MLFTTEQHTQEARIVEETEGNEKKLKLLLKERERGYLSI